MQDETGSGKPATLAPDAAAQHLRDLHPDWQIRENRLHRRLAFRGFAKPVYHANLAAWLGDSENHHPDIRFGWGYCEVEFTSHDAGGLTERDFRSARLLDRLLEAPGPGREKG